MTSKTKTVLLRFVRSLAALVVAAVATWVVSPSALDLVPTQYQSFVFLLVAPALVALDKYLRYGSDSGEDTPPSP